MLRTLIVLIVLLTLSCAPAASPSRPDDITPAEAFTDGYLIGYLAGAQVVLSIYEPDTLRREQVEDWVMDEALRITRLEP